MGDEQGLIIFGDGLQALYYDETHEYVNRYDKKVKKILMSPGANLRKRFKLTDEKLPVIMDDGRRGVWVEYPSAYLFWRSRSKVSAVLDIACAFDGGHTEFMSRYDGLLEITEMKDKEIEMWKLVVAGIESRFKEFLTNPPEYIRPVKELEDMIYRKAGAQPEEDEDMQGD